MAVWLPHHFERKGHVQQADAAAGVECIDPRSPGGALFQQ